MAAVWVRGERGAGCVPLPAKPDGSLALRTLQDSFPGCCGLTYVHPDTDTTRGLRLKDGHLYPPSEGWGCFKFLCNFPKENPAENPVKKESCDLIVLGLPWKTTEQTVRDYFEYFGKVRKVWLKRDAKGQSKGFAFIRFSNYFTQMKVLAKKHVIDGRRCDVSVPHSKRGLPFKVFVGGCTEDITPDDLRDYFIKFGEVTDVFIPKPFRPFGFVTFLSPEMAQSVCDNVHIIKGVSLMVSIAAPKFHHMQKKKQNSTPNNIQDDSQREHRDAYDLAKNDNFNVDSLNFQGLRIGSREYFHTSGPDDNSDLSYNKFASIDQNLGSAMMNAWDNYGMHTGVEQNNLSFNDQGGLSNNSYGSGNFYSWMHPSSSSQWNHLQMSVNQQGHPL